VEALKNVDLTLYRGEVLGLVGDNGAGKSTLIKVLAGAILPDSGKILYDGEEVHIRNPKDAKRLGIETIYQDLALIDNLDVPANVFIGREIKRGLLGRIFGWMDLKAMMEKTVELLQRLKIRIESVRERVGSLSGGQRQSVAIGRAIYFDARVLIMDEPTAALGVEGTENVHNLVRHLRTQGFAILVIGHNMNDIFSISDRIMVLKTGRLIGVRKKSETTKDEILRMIILGEAAGSEKEQETVG
jgi:ABC-type sugar transport system ATPase subunit